MPSSSSVDADHGVVTTTNLAAAAAVVPSRQRAGHGHHASPEDFAASLRRQHRIDAICKEHAVPKEFTAHPAGALHANAKPPPGAICVYGRALEAGMRVPLRGFFREALTHFGIAPAQLTPNAYRIVTGFLALCRSEGVPPSLALLRYFFLLRPLSQRHKKGWYFFRSRESSGLRFTGMPSTTSTSIKDWKREFFFLSSPEPWSCPVEWGQPSKSSLKIPVLTGEEKKSAKKLVHAYGGAAVDLRTLCYSNLAALPLRGKKRSLEEANDKKSPPPSTLKLNTALSSGVCSPPPGFPRKPRHPPSRRDGDGSDRLPTRDQLVEAKSELTLAKQDAEQEKAKAELAATGAELAKAEAGLDAAEAKVLKAQAELTAATRAADAEQEEARPGLAVEGAKARLAVAKRALEKELESAKAAAVHQLLCCEEHVRRRAERALEGYRRWRTGCAPAGCTAWLAF